MYCNLDVLATHVGPAAGIAFLVVAIISQCSIFNAYALSGSRGFFAMADDHLFPPFLCRVSKNRGIPHVSIIVMAYGFKKDPVQPLVKNEHVYDYLEEDYYVLEEN